MQNCRIEPTADDGAVKGASGTIGAIGVLGGFLNIKLIHPRFEEIEDRRKSLCCDFSGALDHRSFSSRFDRPLERNQSTSVLDGKTGESLLQFLEGFEVRPQRLFMIGDGVQAHALK